MDTFDLNNLPKANETLKIIYERRAVRKFKDKQIDRAVIENIIDAGRMAPSAINRQPWKFYVLTKKEDIELFEKEISVASAKEILKSGLMNIVKSVTSAISLAHGLDFLKAKNPIFHSAPVVIFLSSPKDNEWATLDIGMCSQNMMLAAKSLGLDSCPIGLGKYVEQTSVFPKLKVSKHEQINLAIIFGYSDEIPAVHERIKNNAFFID